MFIPKLIVRKTDYDYNVKFISELLDPDFLKFNTSLPFQERVYGLIPELKSKIVNGMTNTKRYNEVNLVINERLNNNLDEIDQCIKNVQKELQLFELKWDKKQAKIICYMGCYPVFPRNVIKKEFWVNYNTINERIIKSSIHEINHFVLFEKWKAMHGYLSKTEPIYPEPLWFLKEIAVDPTLNDEFIKEVALYPQQAYPQFYKQTINGICIMDWIKQLYKKRSNMEDFLNLAYDFISSNIDEIKMKCG